MCSQLGWLSSFKCQNCLSLRPQFLPAPISYQIPSRFVQTSQSAPSASNLGLAGDGVGLVCIYSHDSVQTRITNREFVCLCSLAITCLFHSVDQCTPCFSLTAAFNLIHQYQLYKQNSHSGSFRLIIREMKQQRVKTSAKYQKMDWDSSKIRFNSTVYPIFDGQHQKFCRGAPSSAQ